MRSAEPLGQHLVLTIFSILFIISPDPTATANLILQNHYLGKPTLLWPVGQSCGHPPIFLGMMIMLSGRDPKGPVLRDFLYQDYEIKYNSIFTNVSD